MIKIIRSFYGLDQNMLALYLGVNRSSISMAEGYRRSLKFPQNERLYRLFLSIPRQDISRAALEQQVADDGLQEAIAQQIATNEERLSQLKEQLHLLCSGQQKAFNMLAGAQALASHNIEHDKGLINVIRINADRLYRKNCDARRLQIDQDIAALEARQSVLRQKLVELTTAQQLP